MEGRKQRQHLTLQEKDALRRRHQDRPELTYTELQAWVRSRTGKSIGLSTVGKIVKTPMDEAASSHQVKRRLHEAIEPPLLDFVRQREVDGELSDEAIQTRAGELAGKRVSENWVQKFKSRHGVRAASYGRESFRPKHAEIYGLEYDADRREATCKFCEVFGREIGRKEVRRFTTFRADLYRQHLTTAHPRKWREYQRLMRKEEKEAFFGVEMQWEQEEEMEEEGPRAEEERAELRGEMQEQEARQQVETLEEETAQEVVTIETESTEGPERQVDRRRTVQVVEAAQPVQGSEQEEEVSDGRQSDRQQFEQIPPPTQRSQLLAMIADMVANQKATIASLQLAISSLQQDDLELRRQELRVREQELACFRAEREEMEKERRARETERRAEREHFMALLQALQNR